MAAPTFVAEHEATFGDGTSPKTVSVTVAAGDVLVVVGGSEDQSFTLGTPTGGGLTYTLQQSVVVVNYCTAYGWTAPSASGQTFTMSVTRSGAGGWFGYNAVRFSGSDGIGASAKTNVASGAPTLNITTTQDNSAIVVIVTDWSAVDGASRTWRTVNGITPSAGNGLELTYLRDAAHYAAYVAYYPDAGAAGAKTVGLSAPAGQKYSIIAVEVKGTAAGQSISPAGISVPVAPGAPTLVWSGSVAPDGIATPVAVGSPTATAQSTATPDGIGVPVTVGTPTLTWTGSIAPDGVAVPVAAGSPIVGAEPVAPDGIAVPVTLGAPALTWSAAVGPAGISVPVVVGNPSVSIPGAIIVRPDTGTVVRPFTGSVLRPFTGLITRPFTGDTTRP